MILNLKNIGKVQTASVELNGITVIAGENNTGKSTVGKVLYSIFNSFYKIEDQITKEREESIARALDLIHRNVVNSEIDTEDIARRIVESRSQYETDPALSKKEIFDIMVQFDSSFEEDIEKNNFNEGLNRIVEIIGISDEEIFQTVLSKKMRVEFNGQINNIFSEKEGSIELEIKGKSVEILISNDRVEKISSKFDLNTEIIYIDDPFVLDEKGYRFFPRRPNSRYIDHRSHLKSKLFSQERENSIINEIITTNKLDSIYKKINTICSGEMVQDKRTSIGYKKAGSDKLLSINNISTGLKTFVILKTLLQNGSLEENGTIILDEPEIHLHPEWQLLFAEIIVLIQKEFNMHILLNTHSPYFLNAIEVYSGKYGIADKCKYYIATEKGDSSVIEDVTDNTEAIYSKLARPLQKLENEKYNYD